MNTRDAKTNSWRKAGSLTATGRTAERNAKRALLPALPFDLNGRPQRGMFGRVESVDVQGVSGWLVDAGDVNAEQPVTVSLDGVEIFNAAAKTFRSDVSESLGRTVYCGFQFRWRDLRTNDQLPPPALRRGQLAVTVGPNGVPLSLPAVPTADTIYGWVDFYLSRLLLVLGTSQAAAPPMRSDRELLSMFFDAKYYRALHPGAGTEEVELLDHFVSVGWQQGCDPCPDFSCSYYLSTNLDVRNSGINPFLHYLRAGKSEGRLPRAPGGFRSAVLRDQLPLSEVARSWRRTDAMRSVSRSVLLLRLDELLKGIPPSGLVVSFSHDNYMSNVGGIQLCLAIEQQAFNADNVAYLHLSPWQPSPMLYGGRDPDQVGMRVLFNGTEVGNTLGSDMVAVVQALRTRWSAVPAWLVVHALHGHSTETVSQIHAKLQPTRAFFWLHDYFSVCTGYNLLRNQVAFCSAPDSGSPACGICIYGESRARHLRRIEALFAAVPLTAVAPSRRAAMLWQQSTALSVAETLVVPHCEVVFEGHRLDGVSGWDDAEDVWAEGNKPRVAFVGHPVVHKGWPVFQELVRQLCGTGQYEFWHLGTQPDLQLPIKFIEVKVTHDETDAMIRALEANSIDVVVQWSIWPETFGIAARECVAAGAYLVTSTSSGAVADFVLESGGGLVLETEAALIECFRSGQLLEVVCERRRAGVSVGRLEWGRLTAGLIAPATVVRAKG